MGTWGIGILEDDLTLDVHGDFIEFYNEEIELPDIRRLILDRYAEFIIDSPESSAKIWLGLAQAEWECGWLQAETYEEVKRIISQGYDVNSWPVEVREKRAKVLVRFQMRLNAPPKRIRRRFKRKVPAAIFEPGVCLAIKLFNGCWGAAIVLDLMKTKYDTLHLVGGLRGNFPKPPALDVFEQRDWLVLTHHNWKGTLHLNWCGSTHYKNDVKKSFTSIEQGKTKLREKEPILDNPFGIGVTWWCVENGIRLQYKLDNLPERE